MDATRREIRIPTKYHPPGILQPPSVSSIRDTSSSAVKEGTRRGKTRKTNSGNEKKAFSKPFSLSPASNPTLAHLSYITLLQTSVAYKYHILHATQHFSLTLSLSVLESTPSRRQLGTG